MSSPSDSNIPVLTEVISVGDTTLVPGLNTETESKTTASASPALSELDLEQLEKTVRENVLRQLLTRVDFVLEHRVRDSLADVLQTAVDDLAKDIRAGLTKSLEEVIQRTVNQEISKLQSTQIKN